MKVIIAGSRDIENKQLLEKTISDAKIKKGIVITEVVCGLAKGVDILGKIWGETEHIPIKEFPANWNKYGKVAGMIRNNQMAEYADALIAICKNRSKGTMHMINKMKNMNKPVYEAHIN